MKDIPVRIFSMKHPQAGWIEFSIPLQSPSDVASYLSRILEPLPAIDQMMIHDEMMKRAEKNPFCSSPRSHPNPGANSNLRAGGAGGWRQALPSAEPPSKRENCERQH